MSAASASPVSLAVVHDPGGLSFLAADGRSVGAFERVDGAQVGGVDLPPAIRGWLARQRGGWLALQLSEPLIDRPWEHAADGSGTLEERFTVVRQLMGSGAAAAPALQHRPAGNRLHLLRLHAAATDASAAAALPLPLPLPSRMVVRSLRLDPTEPRWTAAVVDGAAGSDIVLGWGALSGAQSGELVSALAAMPLSPRLLAWAAPAGAIDGALVLAGCRAGFSVLPLSADTPADADRALVPFWRALAEGSTFGAAARQLRAAARGDGHPAARAWFYGDGMHVPLPPGAAPAPDDEVRQCTMLKCDLVESTRQMGRLGDEEYSERLMQYHARVASIVQSHDGMADDPQGDDGVMCYFGYPLAGEQAPARALRAALRLREAVADLDWQLRIGVSTGRVVVRDGQPVGVAVHHAARLQTLAEPGGVLVADTTRDLLSEDFDFSLAHEQAELKGFEQSGAVYRLLRERANRGTERFDSRLQLTRFVGRDAELDSLRRIWQTVAAGRRHALQVSGEAGIGKSRLLREFRRQVMGSDERVFECRCAPEHQGSALHPVIDMLRRKLGLRSSDSPARQLLRLRASKLSQRSGDEALALVAALLSLQVGGLPALPDDGAAAQRSRTMALLQQWLAQQAESGPVCVIFEDVHWADPSTRELVRRIIDGDPDERVLVLLSRRSGPHEPADGGFDALPQLVLGGLPPPLAISMLDDASVGAGLDPELVRWLAERADGVPLFIEESAHMAGALAARLGVERDAAALSEALRGAVPATLEGLLMARLDQLPSAKRAAQLGGAIGRAFPLALIEAVNDHPSSPIRLPDLAHELAALEQAGLICLQGEAGQHFYLFKHALVRDAAHLSLLERDRRRLHGAIAAVLQERFAGLLAQQPELLALHHEQAGMTAEALVGWERAARHAMSRSAHDEAIGHLRHALALLAHQPASTDRDRFELRLQLSLAGRLIATAGYGADAVEAVYGRAQALCAAVGDHAALVKVRLGLEGWHFMRGNFAQALEIERQVAAAVERQSDPLPRIQSAWALANQTFHQGQVAEAVVQMDRCLADYEQLGHRALAVQDPGVMCLCYSSWGLWELGRADEALSRARKVVDLAEGLDHRFSMGEAWGFLAAAHCFRGEVDAGLEAARRAIEICQAGGFAVWLAHAKVMHGRLLAETDPEAGIEEMRQGDAMWAATGAVVTRPFYLALRAEGLARAGRIDDALALLDEATALVKRCGERYWEPELRRLTGELLLRSPTRRDPAAAEGWLASGLACARSARLHGLALRSAIALGRLWVASGRPAEAIAVLQQALDALTEGYATADRRQARALLAGWREAQPQH